LAQVAISNADIAVYQFYNQHFGLHAPIVMLFRRSYTCVALS
jgi:hypothetical protein